MNINQIVGEDPDGLTLHDRYVARLVDCPVESCQQRAGGNCNGGEGPHPERVRLGLEAAARYRSEETT